MNRRFMPTLCVEMLYASSMHFPLTFRRNVWVTTSYYESSIHLKRDQHKVLAIEWLGNRQIAVAIDQGCLLFGLLSTTTITIGLCYCLRCTTNRLCSRTHNQQSHVFSTNLKRQMLKDKCLPNHNQSLGYSRWLVVKQHLQQAIDRLPQLLPKAITFTAHYQWLGNRQIAVAI